MRWLPPVVVILLLISNVVCLYELRASFVRERHTISQAKDILAAARKHEQNTRDAMIVVRQWETASKSFEATANRCLTTLRNISN